MVAVPSLEGYMFHHLSWRGKTYSNQVHMAHVLTPFVPRYHFIPSEHRLRTTTALAEWMTAEALPKPGLQRRLELDFA